MTNINALRKGIEQGTESVVAKLRTTVSDVSTSANEHLAPIESQKVYGENLSALGCKINKTNNGKYINKALHDEYAKKAFSEFCEVLKTKSPDEAASLVLKELNDKNYKIVEMLCFDVREYSTKMEKIKELVGEKNFNEKINPQLKKLYSEYVDKLWEDKSVTLEDMLTLRPDWSFSRVLKKVDFNNRFTIGKLPTDFVNDTEFEILCKYLEKISDSDKTSTQKILDLNLNGKVLKIKRFTDGQSTQGVFEVTVGEKTFVVKMHGNGKYSDEFFEGAEKIKSCPDRAVFTDVYLTNNNCKNAAKLYYYDYVPQTGKNWTVSEFVKADNGVNLSNLEKSAKLSDMESLNVRFVDTIGHNNIIMRDGIPVCVDNKFSAIDMPFDLQIWGKTYSKMAMLN